MSEDNDPWEICAPEQVVILPGDDVKGDKLAKYIQEKVMPVFQKEQARLQKLEAWGTGKQPIPKARKRNLEKEVLQRFSRNPFIPLMISTFAQQMIVDGFRRDGETENQEAWGSWNDNNMPAQQFTLNRAVLMYGYAYEKVVNGKTADEAAKAVMRVVDPQNAFAIYTDPYGDEYPRYLLEKRFDGTYWWWTESNYSVFDKNGNDWKFIEEKEHPYGIVPFVRYVDKIDAKGRTWGEVEPVVEIAARIDRTSLDRLLVQHNNSWKIRWATGLEQPSTEEGVREAAMEMSHSSMLMSSNEQAKFGTLEETTMDSFIAAYKSDLETFLTVAQLPPDLAGQVANIAADALEGARRSTYQKLAELQTMMGQSHAQALRLVAQIEGRPEDAADYSARVHWQDVEVRSLAQFADAWGKICGQLGVPKWAPWDMIPGVDQYRVEEWKKNFFEDGGDMGKLNKYLRELDIKPAGAQPGQKGGTTSLQNQKPVKPDETV